MTHTVVTHLRKIIWGGIVVLGIGHGLLMVEWAGRWGFFGGLMHWFDTFVDPVSAAAGLDLIALYLIVAGWMLYREKGWKPVHSIILIPYFLFPSLGLLLYLVLSSTPLPGEKSR
jgi:CHASE2 domain-containing sensor protein